MKSSPATQSLLHSKLMPPRLSSAVVERARLLARLDAGLAKKVSLISAPTGFGKTTLVGMWIASRDVPSAWVTLDEHDNDPVRFWTYVCSALRTLDPGLGKVTLSMLTGPQPPSLVSLLTPLLNELMRLKAAAVLVLEDYQSIRAEEINKGVSFLLQHLPERLHLIVITRTDPDLPLPILRARDELLEIGAPDLRFNQNEVEEFLQTVTKENLPPSVVTSLLQRTEGWPAGLRLGMLTLQEQGNASMEKWVEAFSGSSRYISDYLIEEVFERQPADMQSFLLRTSFFNRLTGSLCDALLETNESAAILERLGRDNLFLVQLEQGRDQIWYRYNALFAESLQHLARQRLTDTEILALFEKASAWYEYQGLLDDAIETALTAKLFDRAMALIETFIEIHDLREMGTIGRWLENIPPPRVLLHPVICFTYAQVMLYSGDRFAPATAARIEPFLRAAETAWRQVEDHPRLGQLLSFRGNVLWWQGDFQKAFEYARQSLEELPEHDAFWRGNSLLSLSSEALSAGRILEAQDLALEARALLGAAQNIYGVLAATQFLAEIFYWQGELEQAEQLNRQIQTEAVGEDSMLDDQGIAALNLAHIAYEKNDLDQAEQLATRASTLAGQRGNELLQVQSTTRLAFIHSARADPARARELLKSLETSIQNPALLREIQDAEALLTVRMNDLSSLEWWMKITSGGNENSLHLQKEREAFTLARLRIGEGKAEEALQLLKPWHEDAAQHGRVRSQVEALCLEALAQRAAARPPEAARALGQALNIGRARGFRRIFLDEGRSLAALIQATLPTLGRAPSLFGASLLQSFAAGVTADLPANHAPGLIEPLSPQELRVLRLLAAGLSNADIARELVVSTNTVKTHVKSIYRKLDVRSRGEAREAARELRLL